MIDRDTIIKLAREAGLFTHREVQPEIERFAVLVAAADVAGGWFRYHTFARAIEAAHGIKEQK